MNETQVIDLRDCDCQEVTETIELPDVEEELAATVYVDMDDD